MALYLYLEYMENTSPSKATIQKRTPTKTNMEPKNEGLEDDVRFETGDFQVPC